MLRHMPHDVEELADYPNKPVELWTVEGFVRPLAEWKGGLA